MDRDKQGSKHAFGAWSDPTNKILGGWLAKHRSVSLVQLPDDSSLAGGNSNCSSRFSSSSSLLVLALRLTAVSSASLAPLSYAAHAATQAVRQRLSFRTLLLAGIVNFGALSNKNLERDQHKKKAHPGLFQFVIFQLHKQVYFNS